MNDCNKEREVTLIRNSINVD